MLNGRYGPYVTDGKKNAKIPKDREPKTLTLEDCRKLIEAAPVRFGRFGKGKAKRRGSQGRDDRPRLPSWRRLPSQGRASPRPT